MQKLEGPVAEAAIFAREDGKIDSQMLLNIGYSLAMLHAAALFPTVIQKMATIPDKLMDAVLEAGPLGDQIMLELFNKWMIEALEDAPDFMAIAPAELKSQFQQMIDYRDRRQKEIADEALVKEVDEAPRLKRVYKKAEK